MHFAGPIRISNAGLHVGVVASQVGSPPFLPLYKPVLAPKHRGLAGDSRMSQGRARHRMSARQARLERARTTQGLVQLHKLVLQAQLGRAR